MKYLIITVAGTARRFNKDTKEETLKCLYYEGDYKKSLLWQLFQNCGEYDRYVIVGGYLYEKLQAFVANNMQEYADKIVLVYNEHYDDYGSGYSLYKGLEVVKPGAESVTFVEGDLYFDKEVFAHVYNSNRSVLTINHEPILSNKAVALYVSTDMHVHYIYDTNHKSLETKEPFVAIYNSAQMWKFADTGRLLDIVKGMTDAQKQSTNLVLIQLYFGPLSAEEYDVVDFATWFNCNTVADYKLVKERMPIC